MKFCGEKTKRVCPAASRKAAFMTIIGACILGIVTLKYYTDIMKLTANLAFSTYSNLKDDGDLDYVTYFWTNNENNLTTEDSFEQNESVPALWNINGPRRFQDQQLKVITDTSSLVTKITKKPHVQTTTNVKNSPNISTEVYCNKTTMTFNDTFVAYCKESPFIICSQPSFKVTTEKTFKITFLRRPSWLTRHELSMSECAYNQCQIDETSVTNETDIVIVYGVHLKDRFRPPQRWRNQIYIMLLWEPPTYTDSHFLKNPKSVWNSQINLIMSYRTDADIFFPYSKLKFSPKPLDRRPNYYEIAKNKTRTAVWVVSHCHTQSKRELYVKEMQKYIDVDIVGGCGQPCSKKNSCDDLSKFKFYLAFENSLCTDYFTEKFFKIFHPGMHVIPVVRGWVDYDRYLPSFTYVNAAHFKSPKDLALHLKNVASDLKTYSKYLEYKDLYVRIPERPGCTICNFLHTNKISEPKIYNIKSKIGDGHCHDPTDL